MEAINTLIDRDRASQKKIAVIGDRMLDEWVHGRIEACQDGCQKFVEERWEQTPGGAANAARQLDNWNANVMLFGTHHEQKSVKTRYLVDGKIAWRHDKDVVGSWTAWRKSQLAELIRWKPACVLVADYMKGFLTDDLIRQVIAHCRERGVPCVADAKRHPSVYRGAIIQCNHVYFEKFQKELAEHDGPVIVTNGGNPPVIFKK